MSALLAWVAIFLTMKAVESTVPAHTYQVRKDWWRWWLALNAVALSLSLLSSTLYTISGPGTVRQLAGFYVVYSFVNYWAHRAKHVWLWRVHELHHAPQHMQVELCLWRHPVETILNLAMAVSLGYLLQVPVETIVSALLIEGSLEAWHHGNIRTPKWLRWLGTILQTPEMHLLHHQTGLHSFNYSPVSAWDWLFRTARIPINWSWQGSIGLASWGNWRRLIWWH